MEFLRSARELMIIFSLEADKDSYKFIKFYQGVLLIEKLVLLITHSSILQYFLFYGSLMRKIIFKRDS